MDKIYLFSPNVTEDIKIAVFDSLNDRIIGQGLKVKEFENILKEKFDLGNVVTLNSCTSALEIAYDLLNLKEGAEVIAPVFTCAATTVPLARRNVKVIFADVKDNLMLDWSDVKSKITNKTKAIINVHLFGEYNPNEDVDIPIVGDSAQHLGKTFGETFTAYSFQATKIVTTINGGALVCAYNSDYEKAKLLRWYGIDREADVLDSDICFPGYKFDLSNIEATMGIVGLSHLDEWKTKRTELQMEYKKLLGDKAIGGSPFLIHVDNREEIIKMLNINEVETGLVHKRNDLYSIFGGKKQNLQNMNRLEDKYLFLPCHNNMTIKDVEFISDVINKST